MTMQPEHFTAVLCSGHNEDALEVPFDPRERWGMKAESLRPGRRGFPVSGTLNGILFVGAIVSRSRRFWLVVSATTERAAGVSVGDSVAIEIAPGNSLEPTSKREWKSFRW